MEWDPPGQVYSAFCYLSAVQFDDPAFIFKFKATYLWDVTSVVVFTQISRDICVLLYNGANSGPRMADSILH